MHDFLRKYDKKEFEKFLHEFLPDDASFVDKDLKLDDTFKYFTKSTLVAKVDSLNDLKIIEIEHNNSEKSRITISRDLFRLLSLLAFSNALIITYSKKEENYRFSLITSTLEWISDKNIKKKFSNPKRLSFLLGPNSKIHTPTKQLIKLGKIKNFLDLNNRFNIEVLNKEFFDDYKKLYFYLKKYLDEDKVFSSFAMKIKLETNFFAKKLLGQIVFCYFLQKKGWLGVSENKNFGTGDQSFLRNKFIQFEKKNKNFFNEFLEFFFYEGLNNQNKNDYLKKIECKVPYIGGGLFEYYEGYDWKKETLKIPNKTFSNKEQSGILDIFDLYNFTVDENEDLDIELSIDPEMLGRVFENLLPENIKKEGGAYYTPRVIVNYMCEEAIINFLFNKLSKNFSIKEITDFIKDKNIDLRKENLYRSNAEIIDNLLYNVSICDPAVGSGAFAVSIMNIVVKLRSKLKNFVNKKYKTSSYYFKRDFIRNNIYGVDIDEYAIEITKLRLWLSLIVDETDYNKTEPLPNLDFKIIQGNSLLETFEDINLGSKIFEGKKQQVLEDLSTKSEMENSIEDLAILQNKFLLAASYSKKKNIKRDVENAMIKIFTNLMNLKNSKIKLTANNIKKLISTKYKRNFFPWGIFFANIFFNNKGFDIVIANPPYINIKEISKFDWKKKLETNFGYVDDLYSHFSFLATYIAKDEGIIAFITSDTFMTLQTKKNMRNLLFKYNLIKFLTTPKAFKAMVNTSIFFLQKKIIKDDKYINFVNLSDIKIEIKESKGKKTKLVNWEKALNPIFKNINNMKGTNILSSIYKENLNSVIFNPSKKNLKIKEKLIPELKKIYQNYWNVFKTSKKISQNKKILDHYNKNLKENSLTMMGLITEGGVGLQTGDNGEFVGCLKGTKESYRIDNQRPVKLFNLIKNKRNFIKEFKEFSNIDSLSKMKEFLESVNEEKIQDCFSKIKQKFGRDIFGQGFLYRIITNEQVVDLENLSQKNKMEGINHEKKIYVKYDKGDREGNRWYLQTPYLIKWDKKSILNYKTNQRARWQGYDFFFKSGFCWSDVHTVYLKSRFKEKSVHDVLSMSLSSINEKIDNKYLVCLINSKFISEFQQDFLNNTSHFQINDARKIPIIVPNKKKLKEFINIFDEAKNIKLSYFKNIITEEEQIKELEKIQLKIDIEVDQLYNL